MLLFETTKDPSLRRVYATIDYWAHEAQIETLDMAMGAYVAIWGHSADEKSAFLQSWDRRWQAHQTLERFTAGFFRYKTPWRYTDDGAKYCCEVMELPLDGLFIALRCDGGDHDGNADVLAYFHSLAKAIAFVDRFPGPHIAACQLQQSLSHG